MARALEDILRELDASYKPQRESINQRINALPAQADAEIGGLEAKQTQAFDSILAGARNRGLGFSGIPLGEQAQYTASEFLPAVARVRSSQNETKRSLFDALNGIDLDQNRYAQTLRQSELDRDEQQRQFNESLAAQNRATAAQNSIYDGLFDNNNQVDEPPVQPTQPQQGVDPVHLKAYGDVSNLLTKDKARIQREAQAIRKSASYGNTYDKLKLQLLTQLKPDWFGGTVPSSALGNAGQLRF